MKYLALTLLVFLSFQCKNASNDGEIVEVETTETSQTNEDFSDYAMAEFTIEGMTCAMGCAKTIEDNLNKMEGVGSAMVNFDTKMAQVKFDDSLLSLEDLEASVTASGDMYKVVDLKIVESFTNSSTEKKACTMACCEGKTEAEKLACSMPCCKTEAKMCQADCEKPCCKEKASKKMCKADCDKPCCKDKAMSEKKEDCKPGCEKACCKDKKS